MRLIPSVLLVALLLVVAVGLPAQAHCVPKHPQHCGTPTPTPTPTLDPRLAPLTWLSNTPHDTSIDLDWSSDPTGMRDEYRVYYTPQGGSESMQVFPSSLGTLTGLTAGTTYSLQVTAHFPDGAESQRSSVLTVTTTGAPTPTPTPTETPTPTPTATPTPTPTATPPPTCSPFSWGCFTNPLGVPLTWRPWMDLAPWNLGTAGATVHPNSAAMVSYLLSVSGGGTGNGRAQNMVKGPIDAPYGDGASWHFADSDDPVYTIHCTRYACPEIEGDQVRIPAQAKPPQVFSDRHLSVVQPSGLEYDFWETTNPSGTGGTLNISSGGATRIDGDSTGSNATAGQTATPAGEIRSDQWINGYIPHAIGLSIHRTNPSSVYPVNEHDDSNGDGQCDGHLASSDPASPVPNGQWFKLNITDAELLAEPAWRRAIYQALRDFGGFVIDTGGDGLSYSGHNEWSYVSYGQQDPAYSWLLGQVGVVVNADNQAVARTPTFPFNKLVALNPPPDPNGCTPPNDG